MFIRFFILFALFLYLDAIELKQTYYVDSNNISLCDIVKTKKHAVIYKIDQNRYTKKVKSKELIKLLKRYGYNQFHTKHRYIKFIKKSPINTAKINAFLKNYYKTNYKNINIKKISIQPRGYMAFLPKDYTIEIKSRNFLSKSGILDIKTPKNKKFFFNYDVEATVFVYISKTKIKRGDQLTLLNTEKKSIILDKFRALPIQSIDEVGFEAKHNIKRDTIITSRDVKSLALIKKNSLINVFIHNHNLSITFGAKALDDGRLGESIRIQKSNNKRLRAIVVGKNTAEIR